MCCTTNASMTMTDTLLYAAKVNHPVLKKAIQVVAYSTTIDVELTHGGQALIFFLPLNPATTFGQDSVLEVEETDRHFLKDMQDSLGLFQPVPKAYRELSARVSSVDVPEPVAVFDSGIYRVVASSNPEKFIQALQTQVPLEKRPQPNPILMQQIAQRRAGWACVAFCFNASHVKSLMSPPILLWYEQRPELQGTVTFPMFDGHGVLPVHNQKVKRNHALMIGVDHNYFGAKSIAYEPMPNRELWPYLPRMAAGVRFDGNHMNGDWRFSWEDLRKGDWSLNSDNIIF